MRSVTALQSVISVSVTSVGRCRLQREVVEEWWRGCYRGQQQQLLCQQQSNVPCRRPRNDSQRGELLVWSQRLRDSITSWHLLRLQRPDRHQEQLSISPRLELWGRCGVWSGRQGSRWWDEGCSAMLRSRLGRHHEAYTNVRASFQRGDARSSACKSPLSAAFCKLSCTFCLEYLPLGDICREQLNEIFDETLDFSQFLILGAQEKR